MKLHILTLTWNGQDKIERLWPGLKSNMENSGVECIWHVRDNGSKDETVAFLNEKHSTVVYDIGHNRDSFATGVNFLADKANPSGEDLILLLNNDVIFDEPNAIAKMIELHKKTKADVVGARLRFTGTENLQHAGVIFSPRYGNMPYHFRPNEPSDKNAQKNRYFQAVTAAVCLVTAKAFREVGGMDEGFRWAFEDIDMCLKIGQLKPNNIAYCGNTKIYHDESASLKKNPVNKMFMGPNAALFKKKWTGKYVLDHEDYLKNNKHNEIKV